MGDRRRKGRSKGTEGKIRERKEGRGGKESKKQSTNNEPVSPICWLSREGTMELTKRIKLPRVLEQEQGLNLGYGVAGSVIEHLTNMHEVLGSTNPIMDKKKNRLA